MNLATTIPAAPKGKAWHSQSAEEVLAQLGPKRPDFLPPKQHNASPLTARTS